MRNISYKLEPIASVSSILPDILGEYFGQSFQTEEAQENIKSRLSELDSSLQVCIEYPYVDKLYRNTYYNYFATKREDYSRHCIRLSFFKKDYNLDDLDTTSEQDNEACVGYQILRPLYPLFFGRGLLSKQALIDSNFTACEYEETIVVNGKKFKISGFPYSAQDNEYSTCAETAIWEVMEYFSQKYSEHKAALPSQIIKVLSKYAYERQVPSRGLFVNQISFALKDFHLSTRIYSKGGGIVNLGTEEAYREFFRILYYYVNSGIPVVCILDTKKKLKHAVVYIGYRTPETKNFENVKPFHYFTDDATQAKIGVVDYGDAISRYAIIDDNRMSYQMGNFSVPDQPETKGFNYSSYYDKEETEVKDEKVVKEEKEEKEEKEDRRRIKKPFLVDYVVPLPTKVYLEASQAREFMLKIIKNYPISDNSFNPLYLRLFLTKSRTYKTWVAKQENLPLGVRKIIIGSDMPKFIWVGELTNKVLGEKEEAVGFIVIDATQTSVQSLDSLILLYHPSTVCYYVNEKLKTRFFNQITSFKMFKN